MLIFSTFIIGIKLPIFIQNLHKDVLRNYFDFTRFVRNYLIPLQNPKFPLWKSALWSFVCMCGGFLTFSTIYIYVMGRKDMRVKIWLRIWGSEGSFWLWRYLFLLFPIFHLFDYQKEGCQNCRIKSSLPYWSHFYFSIFDL